MPNRPVRFSGALVIATVATAPVFFAVPATAAELPGTDTIYVADYYQIEDVGQLFEVDPLTAFATPRGAPTGEAQIGGMDVAPATGLGYLLTVGLDFGDPAKLDEPAELYRLDITTGTISAPVVVTSLLESQEVVRFGCMALDLNPAGVITAACQSPREGEAPLDDGEEPQPLRDYSSVGIIDPVTGIYTSFVTGLPVINALATDPTTGILYAFGRNGEVFALDRAAGTSTRIATTELAGAQSGTGMQAADFDSAGGLWLVPSLEVAHLASRTAIEGDAWRVTMSEGPIRPSPDPDQQSPIGESHALTITGAAATPPPGTITPPPGTGTAPPTGNTPPPSAAKSERLALSGSEPSGALIGAALLLLAGAGAVGARRARRQAPENGVS